MQTTIDHVGLSVADLPAAAAFYAHAFGFAGELEFDLPGGIRGAMLIHPSGPRLELFHRPGANPGIGGVPPLQAVATHGYGHFALAANDIGPVFDRAVGAGATPMIEPSPSPEPGVRFAFLADPEGNLVELVERR